MNFLQILSALRLNQNNQLNPDVSWNGTYFLVVWEDKRELGNLTDVYAARVTSTGQVLDPDGFAVSARTNNQVTPRVIGHFKERRSIIGLGEPTTLTAVVTLFCAKFERPTGAG